MKTKKVLSLILCILLMFSFCSFSVYGADGSDTIKTADMILQAMYVDSNSKDIDCTSQISTGVYGATNALKGLYYFRFPSTFKDEAIAVVLSEPFSINSDHEYNLKFDWGYTYRSTLAFVNASLIYVDNGGKVLKEQVIYISDGENPLKLNLVDVDFKPDVSGVSGGYKCKLQISFYQISSATAQEYFCISQEIDLTDKDDKSTGLLNSIIDWIKQIIEDIKSLPEKISNSLSTFFENLGNKLTELKDGISNFFENLWNNLKSAFEDIGDWFSELGESIGQFFTDLGESIKGFFEMLKNYLLYFQHPVKLNSEGVLVNDKGQPIYTNPFDSAIDQVKETVDGWIADIKDFIDDMDTSRVNVSEYLKTGTGFINDIMSAAPILSACVIFAAAFFVIRKVVGR